MPSAPTIPKDWPFPDSLRQRVSLTFSAQKARMEDGHLLVVLHKVPTPGIPEREGVILWREPDGTWRSTGNGPPMQVLADLIQQYESVVDEMEEDMAKADTAHAYYQIVRRATPVKRAARNMALTLQKARDYVRADRELLLSRDRAYDLERAAELVHEESRAALEFMQAEDLEAQSQLSLRAIKANHQLNLMVALFLPVTAITSAFGMNLVSGLENASFLFFWGVLLFGFIVGYILRIAIELERQSSQKTFRRHRRRKKAT